MCGKMCKTYLDRDYNGLFLLRKCARHISSLRVEKKWARHISSLNVCSIRVEDIGGAPLRQGGAAAPPTVGGKPLLPLTSPSGRQASNQGVACGVPADGATGM